MKKERDNLIKWMSFCFVNEHSYTLKTKLLDQNEMKLKITNTNRQINNWNMDKFSQSKYQQKGLVIFYWMY